MSDRDATELRATAPSREAKAYLQCPKAYCSDTAKARTEGCSHQDALWLSRACGRNGGRSISAERQRDKRGGLERTHVKPAVLVDMWPSCSLTCMGGRVGGERRGGTTRRHAWDRECGAARGRA